MTIFRPMPDTASELVLRDVRQRERLRVPVVGLSQDNFLWHLEVTGSEQSTRAIWANIQMNQNMRTDGILETQLSLVCGASQFSITLPSKVRYLMLSRVSNNQTHMLIIHPGFSKINYQMIMGGSSEDMSLWFSAALTKINVPVKVEWMPWLWKEAQKLKLITQPDVMIGIPVWHLDQRPREWQELVSRYVMEVLNG